MQSIIITCQRSRNFQFPEVSNFNLTKRCDCMKKNLSRIIGLVMAVIAIAFVVFALNHPEMSFPWNNTVPSIVFF